MARRPMQRSRIAHGQSDTAGQESEMKSLSKAQRSDVARKAARKRKPNAAGRKAKTTHRRRIKSASQLLEKLTSRDRNLVERVLAQFPTLTVRRALADLREAGSPVRRHPVGIAAQGAAELVRL